MNAPDRRHCLSGCPISYYASGDTIRSRSVSDTVLCAVVDVPAPPARLLADWDREIRTLLGLEAGEVEVLPLARARARWPQYRHCVQAVSDWTRTRGLGEVLASSDVALMACRGAKYHHDGARYGGSAFCNLFLSEDKGLDLHFPSTGHRIPLGRGTVVVFDTGQPHGVIPRSSGSFDAGDFPSHQDHTQVFLTWELPIEDVGVGQALRIAFDVETARLPHEEQVRFNGLRASVCPQSGLWRHVA